MLKIILAILCTIFATANLSMLDNYLPETTGLNVIAAILIMGCFILDGIYRLNPAAQPNHAVVKSLIIGMIAMILGFMFSIFTVLFHWYSSVGIIIVIALIGSAIVNGIEQLAVISGAPNHTRANTLLAFLCSFTIGMIFDLWFLIAHSWGQPIGVVVTLCTIGVFILQSLNRLGSSLAKQK